jgi:hypothetical protein
MGDGSMERERQKERDIETKIFDGQGKPRLF